MTLSSHDTPIQEKEIVYLPLSFAQQRLWFIEQLNPAKSTYNTYSGLRIAGPLDVPVRERTLAEIVRRHESLRTSFMTIGGEPQQVIEDQVTVNLRLTDLSSQGDSASIEMA